MRFQSQFAKRTEKIKKWSVWRSRFAVLPVRIDEHTMIWLERYAARISPKQDPTDETVRLLVGPHVYIVAQPEIKYEFGEGHLLFSRTQLIRYHTWWWRI
jgi:hypothetical protein